MKTDSEKIAGDVTRDDLKTAAAACIFKARRMRDEAQQREGGNYGAGGGGADPIGRLRVKATRLEEAAHRLEVEADAVVHFEFGDLAGDNVTPPIPFQDGWIYLRGYGCGNCGNAFWTEDDEKRSLKPGTIATCPHCGERRKVADRG